MEDQQQQETRPSKLLSAALASRHNHQWPAYDKPPHYYASQNSCNVKMVAGSAASTSLADTSAASQHTSLLASIQRKLFTLLYIYAILIVSLYLTYAAYYFIQQQQQQQSRSVRRQPSAQELKAADLLQSQQTTEQPTSEEHSKWEAKLNLLERYMELIAIDLQETKDKLKEREKCDCSVSCHFNGTRYEDRSSWQNQCDICTCQKGKISCQPRKCPAPKCDPKAQVTLPGQCCPTCMRQCKHDKLLIKHSEKFTPTTEVNGVRQGSKVCQCLDGRIKCEQMLQPNRQPRGSNGLVNQTTTTTTTTTTLKPSATRVK